MSGNKKGEFLTLNNVNTKLKHKYLKFSHHNMYKQK